MLRDNLKIYIWHNYVANLSHDCNSYKAKLIIFKMHDYYIS